MKETAINRRRDRDQGNGGVPRICICLPFPVLQKKAGSLSPREFRLPSPCREELGKRRPAVRPQEQINTKKEEMGAGYVWLVGLGIWGLVQPGALCEVGTERTTVRPAPARMDRVGARDAWLPLKRDAMPWSARRP